MIDYKILENRVKHGLSAFVGTFATISVATFRTAQEYGVTPDLKKTLIFSAAVSTVSGLLWSMMPAAASDPAEAIEQAKEELYPSFKIAINRVINRETTVAEEKAAQAKAAESTTHRPQSYTNTSTSESGYTRNPEQGGGVMDFGVRRTSVPQKSSASSLHEAERRMKEHDRLRQERDRDRDPTFEREEPILRRDTSFVEPVNRTVFSRDEPSDDDIESMMREYRDE